MLITGPKICDVATCTRPGCTAFTGCQGHAVRSWASRAARAKDQATRVGGDLDRIARDMPGLTSSDRATLALAAQIVRAAAANNAWTSETTP